VGIAMSAAAEVVVRIHYLKQVLKAPPTLSNLDPIPEDLGTSGAEPGLQDNSTTGLFLGQTYELTVTEVYDGEDFAEALRAALAETDLLVLDAPADAVLQAAELSEAAGALLFNSGSGAEALRGTACRARLLHTLPSDAMRADALMQFFVTRRWDEICTTCPRAKTPNSSCCTPTTGTSISPTKTTRSLR
jgi:ABC transporter substrate binding protein (PQQ-dependent alcohol dehydrogenase system)